MAIAELTEEAFVAHEAANEGAGRVRVAVHDASRIEWSLSVPLPKDAALDYSLRVEMQIPSNTFVRHTPWDQMQAFTRLDGPALAAHGDAVSIDQLRRGALAMASQLARASDGFARHCRLAGSLFATAAHSELEDALTIWIEAAVRISQEARERLTCAPAEEPAELGRERLLVDEYISVRLLEALAGAERGLSGLAQSKSPSATLIQPVVAAVEARLAEVLSDELGYREERGFQHADPSSATALERYLERSSRLKKHFQEVLFLDQETFQIAERAYHWIAGFVAVVASTWAFAWQIALANKASSAQTFSTGLLTLALIAGVVYATKDRIKEIGRNWMTTRVHRVWGAQRITRYRAPARRLPGRDVVVTARESFDQGVASLPDPLNPESGATVPVTIVSYEHKGSVVPHAALLASGVRRVKHVFRYDLSPMFARLDDAMKPVPVLDEGSRKVRFIDAPRCYRVPIRVRVECDGHLFEEMSTLVLHKRGLERLDRADQELPSNPSLAEIGIEPG
ncbi:MAG TPA: hypothetical protein VLT33_36470 [Labilithrix sp.]|nr:hypothetical protein [Labilithrix sp.]